MNHRRDAFPQKTWHLSNNEHCEMPELGTPQEPRECWWQLLGGPHDLGSLGICTDSLSCLLSEDKVRGLFNEKAQLAPKWPFLKRPWHCTTFTCLGLQREMKLLLLSRFPQCIVVSDLMWLHIWTDTFWGKSSPTHQQTANTSVSLSLVSKINSVFHLFRISISYFVPLLETMLKIIHYCNFKMIYLY